jgi:hypothetical protein
LESLLKTLKETGTTTTPEPEDILSTVIPANLLSEANSVQSNCTELLRHFWASLGSRERCDRIAESLDKMGERIKIIQAGFRGSEGEVFKGLIGPIRKSIEAALKRYSQL